jgi:ubiquinone/menaquinone biosynthesis C-methylase UbiE
MSLRTEYDGWHERVFNADPAHEDASSPWYELVREQIGKVAGLRILEVACGRGGFVRELARKGAHVAGCDFSLAALRVGQEKLRALENGTSPTLTQGDAQALPFADESFDVVVSCETIEHVPDVRKALREMWRVARPGGKLFLTTPNYANLMGLYDLYARVRHPGHKDDQPFDRRQWFPQIRGYVRGAGWNILRSDGTVHQLPIFLGRNPVGLPALESNHLIRRLLSPLAYHYFLISEKRGRG